MGRGALTALNAIVHITGLNLPNDDLVTKAGANTREIARELSENTDAAQVVQALRAAVRRLRRGQDASQPAGDRGLELPSAEELGADFEEFLRNHPES